MYVIRIESLNCKIDALMFKLSIKKRDIKNIS